MNNIFGLMAEVFSFIGVPIIFLICLIYLIGKKDFNDKIKKIVLLVFSLIYNYIIGFFSYIISFTIAFNPVNSFSTKIYYIILFIVFGCLIIPINYYIQRKSKINIIIYTILSTLIIFFGIFSIISYVKIKI